MANGIPGPPLAPFYDTAQYPERSGRLVAAPTIHLFRITVYSTCLSCIVFQKMSKTWYITVGAATWRPPRIEYNLCG